MPYKNPADAAANRAKRKDRLVEGNRRWRRKDPSANRRHWLKQYNITLWEFEELFVFQGRKCACCSRLESEQWCVDHDHAKGITFVRGILCIRCNSILALMGDTLEGVTVMNWPFGIHYLSEVAPLLHFKLAEMRMSRSDLTLAPDSSILFSG